MNELMDLGLTLPNEPGALADFGQVLGNAGVSLEGGGVFTHDGVAVAHFLVADAQRARTALEAAGFGPVTISPAVMVGLDQETPGQLGAFTRRLGEGGINILVQYSDHDHRLVVVTAGAQHDAAALIARRWAVSRGHAAAAGP